MDADEILSKIPTKLQYALDEEFTPGYSPSQILLSCAVLPSSPDTIMYGSAWRPDFPGAPREAP